MITTTSTAFTPRSNKAARKNFDGQLAGKRQRDADRNPRNPFATRGNDSEVLTRETGVSGHSAPFRSRKSGNLLPISHLEPLRQPKRGQNDFILEGFRFDMAEIRTNSTPEN